MRKRRLLPFRYFFFRFVTITEYYFLFLAAVAGTRRNYEAPHARDLYPSTPKNGFEKKRLRECIRPDDKSHGRDM